MASVSAEVSLVVDFDLAKVGASSYVIIKKCWGWESFSFHHWGVYCVLERRGEGIGERMFSFLSPLLLFSASCLLLLPALCFSMLNDWDRDPMTGKTYVDWVGGFFFWFFAAWCCA
jgi:hypothetical protein